MKKAIAVLALGAFALASTPAPSFAATDNEAVNVNINVNAAYDLVVTANQTLNFPAQSAPFEVFDTVGLNVISNHGLTWSLQLSGTPLLHTDGTTTMNFRNA